MKNTKSWRKVVSIPLYFGELSIGIGPTIKDAVIASKIKGWDGGDLEGVCIRDDNGKFALVFDRRYLCHSTIAHEVAHAAFRIAERASWGHNKETVEPYAYLNAWITDEVYKALKSHKERIK